MILQYSQPLVELNKRVHAKHKLESHDIFRGSDGCFLERSSTSTLPYGIDDPCQEKKGTRESKVNLYHFHSDKNSRML